MPGVLGGFAGVPDRVSGAGEFTTGVVSATLPVGFDTVLQCDSELLQASLLRNLEAVGAATPSARVPYFSTVLPPEVAAVVRPLVRQVELVRADEEIDIELRLVGPRLVGLSAGYEPPGGSIVVPSGVATARTAVAVAPSGPPFQIGWTVELNLLRVERPLVFTGGAVVQSPGDGGSGGGLPGGGRPGGGRPGGDARG